MSNIQVLPRLCDSLLKSERHMENHQRGFSERDRQQMAHALEIMIRRIMDELGVNVRAADSAESIMGQAKLVGVAVRHTLGTDDGIDGYYFYKHGRLKVILFEPHMEDGKVVINKGVPR
jgi:hypothetical protein